MWSKINELSRQSLSQMQIAMKLGISRDTVRRYQRMNEKEFEGLISSGEITTLCSENIMLRKHYVSEA